MWKDFLYFPKGDKIAIVLLLILISVGGVFYACAGKFSDNTSAYREEPETASHKFAEFETLTAGQEEVRGESGEGKPASESNRKTAKANSSKLSEGQTIDLNSASEQALERIPGIGTTLAERITAHRKALGGFVSPEQLLEIKGITIAKYSKILPCITVRGKLHKLQVNRDLEEKLSNHPYLSQEQVMQIAVRRKKKRIASMIELMGGEQQSFTPRDTIRLKPYLSFD
jgi:DNA uptake protein ComE-like DNA-binding protein